MQSSFWIVYTVIQNDMLSNILVIKLRCTFWQKINNVSSVVYYESLSDSKPYRKAYHLKYTVLLCDLEICFLHNPMIMIICFKFNEYVNSKSKTHIFLLSKRASWLSLNRNAYHFCW